MGDNSDEYLVVVNTVPLAADRSPVAPAAALFDDDADRHLRTGCGSGGACGQATLKWPGPARRGDGGTRGSSRSSAHRTVQVGGLT
jgi:hypothetical protein